jgi:hypothetical protein
MSFQTTSQKLRMVCSYHFAPVKQALLACFPASCLCRRAHADVVCCRWLVAAVKGKTDMPRSLLSAAISILVPFGLNRWRQIKRYRGSTISLPLPTYPPQKDLALWLTKTRAYMHLGKGYIFFTINTLFIT